MDQHKYIGNDAYNDVTEMVMHEWISINILAMMHIMMSQEAKMRESYDR